MSRRSLREVRATFRRIFRKFLWIRVNLNDCRHLGCYTINMDASKVTDLQSAKKIIEQRGLTHLKVGVFDIDGILRGKYMSKQKFLTAIEHGFGFCDVVLGWDAKDRLYDNAAFTGWHTGYPDASVRILADSAREIPSENGMLFFLGEFSGPAENVCPRGLLRRVIDNAKNAGLSINAGFEYEFFVFNETAQSLRDKSYQHLEPFTPGEFGYSTIRNSVESDLYLKLLNMCEIMNFPIEGLHDETGPGVLEAALVYDTALASADKAALFKTFTKILMQKQNKIATFMAKWSVDCPGQSGHIHISLTDNNGDPKFYDTDKEKNISDTMRYFIGGQQKLMPELLAMIAPTVNSYRRLVPGFWAPTHASVGIDNRTCAIRIIPGSAKSHRLEYRIGAADANPYIILAAAIASGLWGIENKIEIDKLVDGNAYEQKLPKHLKLPDTLWEATQRFKSSKTVRELFGDEFVDHFAASREWEVREFRKHISQWELDRYLEII